ncbi:MAG: ParB/RepB/Spo0J family partition protein [Thermus sp.]|uniref:ParB N-terminal domain-containing protein n=1 Tax=Thermus sp. TaxID=275 RepID=UPI00351B34EF
MESEKRKVAMRALPLSAIAPNPRQPRLRDDAESVADLARSMKEHGLLHPIVVRPLEDGRYEIVAGERRYRAALALGWETIPATVVEMDDVEAYLASLAENVKRRGVPMTATAIALIRFLTEVGGLSLGEALATLKRLGRRRGVPKGENARLVERAVAASGLSPRSAETYAYLLTSVLPLPAIRFLVERRDIPSDALSIVWRMLKVGEEVAQKRPPIPNAQEFVSELAAILSKASERSMEETARELRDLWARYERALRNLELEEREEGELPQEYAEILNALEAPLDALERRVSYLRRVWSRRKKLLEKRLLAAWRAKRAGEEGEASEFLPLDAALNSLFQAYVWSLVMAVHALAGYMGGAPEREKSASPDRIPTAWQASDQLKRVAAELYHLYTERIRETMEALDHKWPASTYMARHRDWMQVEAVRASNRKLKLPWLEVVAALEQETSENGLAALGEVPEEKPEGSERES